MAVATVLGQAYSETGRFCDKVAHDPLGSHPDQTGESAKGEAAMKRLLTEFGMGTSLRRQDYTEAAKRGVRDALWHNSINLAELFGKTKHDMQITVDVGVQNPEAIDTQAIANELPYGQITVQVHKGGLDRQRPDGDGATVMATVAISVALTVEGAA